MRVVSRLLLCIGVAAFSSCGSDAAEDSSDAMWYEHAVRVELPDSGRTTQPISYGDGAFVLFDRRRYGGLAVGRWDEALDEALRLRSGAGHVDGVMYVIGNEATDEAPLEIRRLQTAPGRAGRSFDRVTEIDFHLPTGELSMMSNGDAAVDLVVDVPPGRYRARVSTRLEPEHHRLDLWRVADAEATRVLRRAADRP